MVEKIKKERHNNMFMDDETVGTAEGAATPEATPEGSTVNA